ncbi:MAG: MMPL family transporter, partial [Exiguobacterium marinum]
MEWLGRQLIRFRYGVLLVWAILIAGSVYFGLQLPSELKGNGFAIQDGRFQQVEDTLNERFDRAGASMIVLFEGGDLDAIMDEQQERFEAIPRIN